MEMDVVVGWLTGVGVSLTFLEPRDPELMLPNPPHLGCEHCEAWWLGVGWGTLSELLCFHEGS
jgi:hypothetical protein